MRTKGRCDILRQLDHVRKLNRAIIIDRIIVDDLPLQAHPIARQRLDGHIQIARALPAVSRSIACSPPASTR